MKKPFKKSKKLDAPNVIKPYMTPKDTLIGDTNNFSSIARSKIASIITCTIFIIPIITLFHIIHNSINLPDILGISRWERKLNNC